MSQRYGVEVQPDADNDPHGLALRLVGSGRRVLEVGCATGHLTRHLVAAGNRVVGVELDADAAAQARRYAERVHVLDLDVTPLTDHEDATFDVILLGDVLEHVRDPDPVLADLVRLLEPEGRLVISVPHVGHIDVRLHLLEGRWEYQRVGLLDRTHLRWFTRESLQELLDRAGFTAVRFEPVTRGLGHSLLPIRPELFGPDLVRILEGDPDVYIYQFVVEAKRTGSEPDALAGGTPTWPDLAAEHADHDARVAALEQECASLRAEVDAWRRSRIVRYTEPLRWLRRRLRSGHP